MKKLSALLLALLMGLMLAACGGGEETPPGEGGAEGDSAENKVLRVAMECSYAPYNWTQTTEANGAIPIRDTTDYAYGYDVMMAKYIAEEIGYELEIVKMDWDSIIPAIQAGAVDVGICGQSITADRLMQVDFSDPYYYASIVVLVREDSEYAGASSVADLAGATCASQLNTIWETVCLPQIPDADILPGQDTAPAMIAALTAGRVDVVVTDQPTGLAAMAANSGLKMLEFEGDGAFEVSDEEVNIGISIQKDRAELLEAINAALDKLTVDDYREMMDEAITVQPMNQ